MMCINTHKIIKLRGQVHDAGVYQMYGKIELLRRQIMKRHMDPRAKLGLYYSGSISILLFYIIIELLTLSGNLYGITSILDAPINLVVSGLIIFASSIGIIGINRQNSKLTSLSVSVPLIGLFLSLLYLYALYYENIFHYLLWMQGIIILLVSLFGIFFVQSLSRSITIYNCTMNKSTEDFLKQNNNTEYAVELIDVVKIYDLGPVKVHALNGINLKVKKGDFIAIMGPSGSGKSTLLNQLGALDKPTSGKVLIDGVDISQLDEEELARLRNEKIGFIFQSYNLINRSTVLRNVELPAIIKGIPKEERVKRALKLLRILGLEETAYRRPKTLSGGQQQRVAIARALINKPSIILADEPTGNLDSKSGREVMKYLIKMNRETGTTVIVVTHDREIGEMANRIFHIRDGKIIREEVIGRSYDE